MGLREWLQLTGEEPMRKSRFSEEQMVAMLREADRTSVAEVARKNKVSEQTIYTWRQRFGTLDPADIKRLRALEAENAKLKRMLAEREMADADSSTGHTTCVALHRTTQRVPVEERDEEHEPEDHRADQPRPSRTAPVLLSSGRARAAPGRRATRNDVRKDDCEEMTRRRASKAHAPSYVVPQLARARLFR